MILNLDKYYNPRPDLDGIDFEYFVFAGGEPHIKIKSDLSNTPNIYVSHRLKSFNDFGLLLLAIDALKRMGVKTIDCILPYFPGARQDRVMVPGEPLSVKVYAEILNQLKLHSITIYDPHSEVTPALLDNCVVLNNHAFIKDVLSRLPKDTLLISPDGGALKKIHKVASFLEKYDVVECSKLRDVKTGKLSGFRVNGDVANRSCLIVDDICDGGGTFLGLGKELKFKGATNIFLAISHGIFSKGTDDLQSLFKDIYTTNSFKDMNQKNINVFNITTNPKN